MRLTFAVLSVAVVLSVLSGAPPDASASDDTERPARNIQVGPRPYYLVDDMSPSPLKTALERCSDKPIRKSDFSIGHRGAALQFPEHTKESYAAAARMGAGIVECDVTFTQDRQLVCRHSQCDLHTTTNILATPLAGKCAVPFRPAVVDADGNVTTPATAQCCTSDITLAEFKTLQGKMDAFNPAATTVAEFLGGTASWRTDLHAYQGTLLSHAESIELFKDLGVKMTPELKAPSVPMPFQGTYTQQHYAQQMIDEYKAAGVAPRSVWPQSFSLDDVLYWIDHEPTFGRQAVFLDDANVPGDLPSAAELQSYAARGVRIVAPPIWALLALEDNRIVPSQYVKDARAARLDIITWTLERSGLLTDGGGFYYQTVSPVITHPGDMLEVLDVLARDVRILGIFSDWPGTVTYYANCMGLK
jgi:glycerophosphoryl diester phosphodiesterase